MQHALFEGRAMLIEWPGFVVGSLAVGAGTAAVVSGFALSTLEGVSAAVLTMVGGWMIREIRKARVEQERAHIEALKHAARVDDALGIVETHLAINQEDEGRLPVEMRNRPLRSLVVEQVVEQRADRAALDAHMRASDAHMKGTAS